MKKRLSFIISIILILCLALSGCSKEDTKPSSDTGKITDDTKITDSLPSDSGHTVTEAPTAINSTDESIEVTAAIDSVHSLSGSSSIKSEEAEFLAPGYSAGAPSIRDDGESDVSEESFAAAMGDMMTDDFISYDFSDSAYEPAAPDAIESIPDIDIEPEIDIIPEKPQNVTAGLLTAGEWKDNTNYEFIKNLLINGQDADYQQYFKDWKLTPFRRIRVCCYTGAAEVSGPSVENAVVKLYDSEGNILFTGRSDNEGMVYVYYTLVNSQAVPKTLEATFADETLTHELTSDELADDVLVSFGFASDCIKAPALDLMFVVDTTGSMGDEIYYLQAELSDVIKRVKESNNNLPIRLSVNFYRDIDDEYVVRPYPFSEDIETQLSYLNREYAMGGGDYEEAVEQALDDAINNHDWNEDSVKLLFIVLDAPPHNTPEIQSKLASIISSASAKGIRIIPVASSGVDKNTEFLLRTFAMTTGGTYTFLTGHSGIGGSHIEPTIGSYTVENLNDLLVRVIDSYIGIIDEVKPYVAPVVIEPIIIDDDIIIDPIYYDLEEYRTEE